MSHQLFEAESIELDEAEPIESEKKSEKEPLMGPSADSTLAMAGLLAKAIDRKKSKRTKAKIKQVANTSFEVTKELVLSALFLGLAIEKGLKKTWGKFGAIDPSMPYLLSQYTWGFFGILEAVALIKNGCGEYNSLRNYNSVRQEFTAFNTAGTVVSYGDRQRYCNEIDRIYLKRTAGDALTQDETKVLTILDNSKYNKGSSWLGTIIGGLAKLAAPFFGGFGAGQIALSMFFGTAIVLLPPICFALAFGCSVLGSLEAAFTKGKELGRNKEYYQYDDSTFFTKACSWARQCSLDVKNTFKYGWKSLVKGVLQAAMGTAVVLGLGAFIAALASPAAPALLAGAALIALGFAIVPKLLGKKTKGKALASYSEQAVDAQNDNSTGNHRLRNLLDSTSRANETVALSQVPVAELNADTPAADADGFAAVQDHNLQKLSKLYGLFKTKTVGERVTGVTPKLKSR